MQNGGESPLRAADGSNANTFLAVYRVMLKQVAHDYSFTLHDLRVITEAELRFYYDALRHALKKATKR